MNNVYDILLNYNRDRLYYFYEWLKEDKINHIKKMPAYRLADKQLKKVLNNYIKVDNSFLEKIHNKTEEYHSNKICFIPYSVILGNEYECIAICFDKEGYEISRSDLVIDEKNEVLEMMDNLKTTDINILCTNKIKNREYNTRYEQQNMILIKSELEKALKSNDTGKLKYIYYELYGKYEHDNNKIFNDINNELNEGWSKKCEQIIKIFKIINMRKQI